MEVRVPKTFMSMKIKTHGICEIFLMEMHCAEVDDPLQIIGFEADGLLVGSDCFPAASKIHINPAES